MKMVKDFFKFVILGCAVAVTLYYRYFITKNLSYFWWYEDMVKQTVKDMIKQESLK